RRTRASPKMQALERTCTRENHRAYGAEMVRIMSGCSPGRHLSRVRALLPKFMPRTLTQRTHQPVLLFRKQKNLVRAGGKTGCSCKCPGQWASCRGLSSIGHNNSSASCSSGGMSSLVGNSCLVVETVFQRPDGSLGSIVDRDLPQN